MQKKLLKSNYLIAFNYLNVINTISTISFASYKIYTMYLKKIFTYLSHFIINYYYSRIIIIIIQK